MWKCRVDGLTLTVAIRNSKYRNTPVIVYSSIGDLGMKTRAKYLKADAHITKLNFEELLNQVDQLLKNPLQRCEETEEKLEDLIDETQAAAEEGEPQNQEPVEEPQPEDEPIIDDSLKVEKVAVERKEKKSKSSKDGNRKKSTSRKKKTKKEAVTS